MDKIIKTLITFSIGSILICNAYAENKIEGLPKLEPKNKINKMDKPTAKDIKPLSNKIKSEKLYIYSAIFVGPIKSNTDTIDGNEWSCKASSKTCVTKVSWSSPSVKTCSALAQKKQQKIKSYRFGVKKLSISQLKQCNRGITVATSGSTANKTMMPFGLNKKNKQASDSPAGERQLFQNNASEGKDVRSIPAKEKYNNLSNRNNILLNNQPLSKDVTVDSDVNTGDAVRNTPASGGLLTSKNKLQGKVNTNRETTLTTAQQLEITMRTDKYKKFKAELEKRVEELEKRVEESTVENERRAESVAAVGFYGTGRVYDGGDCDDSDPNQHPNRSETCDEVDNDCDGEVDEGVTQTYYLDADGDLHGNPDERLQACGEGSQLYNGHWLSAVGNDCDDTDPDRWHSCEE
jgi:hypothetical protein